MHGSALCFGGPGVRYAITVPVNTIGGGVVRFSLKLEGDDSGSPVGLPPSTALSLFPHPPSLWPPRRRPPR